MSDLPIIVSFGGGTNSTAMLCGFRERDIAPSLICFADTGGEMPHTYEHVQEMDEKCREWWGLGIERVFKTYKGEFEGLEGEGLRCKQLPSLAYGHKHCSVKYKGDPQDSRLRKWMKENKHLKAVRAIGFGADEPWRSKPQYDEVQLNKKQSYRSWYPLQEWKWRRADCYAAIQRHGIKQPGKSSCFFCPAKKVGEVLRMRETHPHLFNRGTAMEEGAALGTRARDANGIKGLHFGIKWSDMAKADDAQIKLFEWVGEHASSAIPCGCYDGGESTEPRA